MVQKKKRIDADSIIADEPEDKPRFHEQTVARDTTTDVSDQLIDAVSTPRDEEPVDPCHALKTALQALYSERPIYVGLEYNALHKWYTRLEELIR